MRFAILLVLLLACVAIAYTAPVNKRAAATATATVAFSGNVTLTNNTQTQTLAYRKVTAEAFAVNVDLTVVNFDLGFYLSDAVEVTLRTGQSSADLVASGFVYLNADGVYVSYPEAFSAYFDVTTKWTGAASISNTIKHSTTNPATTLIAVDAVVSAFGGLSGSGGIASIAFLGVSEVTASGTTVKNFNFTDLTYTGSASVKTDSTGNIQYAQFTATGASGETYTFTTLTSQVVGKLQYGAILTPKSVNVMIEIDNYQYQTATNYLQLSYIAGYATANFAGNFSVNGNYIASGTAPNAAYISTSTQASSNGAMTTVTATINTNINPATFTQSAKLFGSYFASVNPSFGAALVTVNLPAGSETIIYDPTTGFEQPTNSSANLGISIVSVFIISLLATYFNL